jgi:hypothetical protein
MRFVFFFLAIVDDFILVLVGFRRRGSYLVCFQEEYVKTEDHCHSNLESML